MTVHNILKHASFALVIAAFAFPLHISASEPDGLAQQFQASAKDAAASFRKELKANLAETIRPSIQLDTSLVVATKQLAGIDRTERQTSLAQLNGAE